jgi:uncharacterized protein (DUF488 family)
MPTAPKLHQFYSIGHSTRSWDEFLELLRSFSVEVLCDVRRFPGSRRFPHFTVPQFQEGLVAAGIGYEHFPELGGRRKARTDSPNTNWHNSAFRGYADFMETGEFAKGMDRLLRVAQEKTPAVMCAEALWWQCHRALISDYLLVRGVDIFHITSAGKATAHRFTSAARVESGKLFYSPAATPQDLHL